MKLSRPVIIFSLSLALLLVSCSDSPRVIPRKTLAEIYAEMFVTDEWLQGNRPKVNRLADTSFVYAPILEKYGYDADDYLYSVEKYLADPERFSRILRNTESKLRTRAEELKAIKAEQERLRRLELRRDSIRRFWSVSLDSMNKSFVVPVESDTVIFELFPDSTSVAGVVASADSTSLAFVAAAADSTGCADSVPIVDTAFVPGVVASVDTASFVASADTSAVEQKPVRIYKKMF